MDDLDVATDVATAAAGFRAVGEQAVLRLVWSLVGIGILVPLVGIDQPLVLLVISACVAGAMMFLYSLLLLLLINRRSLPEQIRVRGVRAGVLVFSFAFFGVLSVLTIEEQAGKLF